MMFDNKSLETYLEIAGVITQAELPVVRTQGRLGEYAVAYRIYRRKQGGGFGNTNKKPFAWSVLVYADGLPVRLNSARGDRREWSTLESVSDWMRNNGFRYWWTRNDLEFAPVEEPTVAEAPVTADAEALAATEALVVAKPAVETDAPVEADAPAASVEGGVIVESATGVEGDLSATPDVMAPVVPAMDPALAALPYAYGDAAAAYIAEANAASYYTGAVQADYLSDGQVEGAELVGAAEIAAVGNAADAADRGASEEKAG